MTNLDFDEKYQFFELFAGEGAVSRVWCLGGKYSGLREIWIQGHGVLFTVVGGWNMLFRLGILTWVGAPVPDPTPQTPPPIFPNPHFLLLLRGGALVLGGVLGLI